MPRRTAAIAAAISPLKLRASSRAMSVKKLFRLNCRTAFLSISPLKTPNIPTRTAQRGVIFQSHFLSNKKVPGFFGEKIDGPYPATISSALGSGQPHPVVVSNV